MEVCTNVGVGAGVENDPKHSFCSHPHVGGKLSEFVHIDSSTKPKQGKALSDLRNN